MTTAKPAVPDDSPLKEDIRLLGRILGDTIKTQEGREVFQTIETVRQLAVRFRRDNDGEARRRLSQVLNRLSRERIRAEWELTTKALFAISQSSEFLAGNPSLARSIKNRFAYLDPLNHLQVELVRRQRAGNTDERIKRGIHLSINGIAAGLRNSG